ncbi:thiaminase II [Marinilabilia sp.]|uniref:thiaminase II n=1 Tax=Marinilabilia sp. TaxID=2021252 RepID=UPI0025BBC632|nr:thiaminase II [Marinilabilia sp.]
MTQNFIPDCLPAGPFTRKLWSDTECVIAEIINHPFCTQLAEGTLSKKSFRHYLGQDILYIEKDARAFAITAGRSDSNEDFDFFLSMARDGLEIERFLHSELLPFFDVKRPAKMSNICSQYTSFLLNTAFNASYPEAVAALLPCFWVYRETGLKIRERAIEDNPYQKWMDTYAGEIYGRYVQQFILIAEKLMEHASPLQLDAMRDSFRQSCEYEKAFFSEAFNF